jgi:hypothetical protein
MYTSNMDVVLKRIFLYIKQCSNILVGLIPSKVLFDYSHFIKIGVDCEGLR